jgi:hypothetical protein
MIGACGIKDLANKDIWPNISLILDGNIALQDPETGHATETHLH